MKILIRNYVLSNVVSLPLSDEMETGSAGEQPVNDNPADWNGQWGLKPTTNFLPIPGNHRLENPNLRI